MLMVPRTILSGSSGGASREPADVAPASPPGRPESTVCLFDPCSQILLSGSRSRHRTQQTQGSAGLANAPQDVAKFKTQNAEKTEDQSTQGAEKSAKASK